jgi:ABC-2 type transport system ATP-binding protein
VPAVEVSGLAKRYSSVTAVADVSLTAETGQVTAVLGRNGAGKTTTVEICAGLRTADAGSVRILGLDPSAHELRHRVGVMPQGGSGASGVYPSARVGEVLGLHAALHSNPLDVAALLDRLELTKLARSTWRRLSGGEQQRLSLALALVGRPEVVFLDEPTAGLDVQGRRTTWDLINELKAAGVAVVLTTHALDEAEQLADEVVIIDAGRVVASGSPAALTARTGDEELHFEARSGLTVANLGDRLGQASVVTEPTPGHYLVTGPVTPDLVAAVTAWCAEQGVIADRVTTGGRSLESVFLALTETDQT